MALPNDDVDPLAREDSPLLDRPSQAPHRPPYALESVLAAHRDRRRAGVLSIVQIAVLVWFVTLATTVLTNPAGLFTFHPMFQSVAVVCFYQGILVLQPTETPAAKRTGLLIHECFQTLGAVSILIGTSVIVYNKIAHAAPHFTSWHGLLGIITATLILVQLIFGAIIGFETCRDRIIGDSFGRKMWKYHRASGYLIISLISLTILTATKSDWLVSVAKPWSIGILIICPVIGVFGLLSLTKFEKIFSR